MFANFKIKNRTQYWKKKGPPLKRGKKSLKNIPIRHFISNSNNRIFFDACDGFFTNYNWTEQSLEWMTDYSGVQGRQADIYIGVDVFARGKVVGGMFETNKVHTMAEGYVFMKKR